MLLPCLQLACTAKAHHSRASVEVAVMSAPTVDKPPAAARGSRTAPTAPTAPAAAKRGVAPDATRRTGTLKAPKMRKTSQQLEATKRAGRSFSTT